mgnify:CR=1 FL=1
MTDRLQKIQQEFTQVMQIDATAEAINQARYGCNRLAASFRAPFLVVASALVIAQVIEKPIKDHEAAMSGSLLKSAVIEKPNIGLNQNIITLNAHLGVIQDELVRWEVHPWPILRIAAFDKNFLESFCSAMSTIVSVASTSIFKFALDSLKIALESASKIVSPVPDATQNEKQFETYMSKYGTAMDHIMKELSNRVQEIESMAAVRKKDLTTPFKQIMTHIRLLNEHPDPSIEEHANSKCAVG